MRQVQSPTIHFLSQRLVPPSSVTKHTIRGREPWHSESTLTMGIAELKPKQTSATSNAKTFCWWNYIFRLLESCIFVSIQPDTMYMTTQWSLITGQTFATKISPKFRNQAQFTKRAPSNSVMQRLPRHDLLHMYVIYLFSNRNLQNKQELYVLTYSISYGLTMVNNVLWHLLLTFSVKCRGKPTSQS